MSEELISTVIGDELEVHIYFDYQPKEKQTHEEPGCDSDVTINGVCVHGQSSQDIQAVLSDRVLECLKLECLESMESSDER